MHYNSPDIPKVFLPPINRSMYELDRSCFKKTVPISVATVRNIRDVSRVRIALEKSKDVLSLGTIKVVQDDETVPGAKCLLLRPEVKAADSESWSPAIKELAEEQTITIRPHDLYLTYDNWSTKNILEAVLPEFPEDEKETPAGFAQAGHVAHINLRAQYLPYRHLIGQVLLDKNDSVKTVINKTEDVGAESEFRTFPYEVLAGENDLDVTIHEAGCEFRFNFGQVYYNTRLSTEHERLVAKFQRGQAVCDVMAGVGPFAVPAAKKGVFLWANDLNPDAFAGLEWAVKRNKVHDFVHTSCQDGRKFIHEATYALRSSPRRLSIPQKTKRDARPKSANNPHPPTARKEPHPAETLTEPSSFDHYVMNLPKTAVEFLDAFTGLYASREAEFEPQTPRKLPMIHVYIFTDKRATAAEEHDDVCARVSRHLGHTISPQDPEIELFDVRLVSPKKRMYCCSIRLPGEVAFKTTSTDGQR